MTEPDAPRVCRETNPRDGWRAHGVKRDGKKVEAADTTGFDEVVVGRWLHLERMSTRWWWLRIGQREADVMVERDGEVKVLWRES